MSTEKQELDYLDYESLSTDLKSLSVLVRCLEDDRINEISDSTVKENCYVLVADMINDRAELADSLFNEYLKMKRD